MMKKQTIAVMGILALTFGLASSAEAASVVDITYDVSNTTFPNSLPGCADSLENNLGLCADTGLLSGSMKIRYTSNSASSMPILSGPASLQSLDLYGQARFSFPYPTASTPTALSPVTRGNFHLVLTSSVVGSLLSGGTLALGTAPIRVTGTRHCSGVDYFGTGLCVAIAGTFTSITGPLGPYTSSPTLSFAAAPGPYGGAQSTPHRVSGSVSVTISAKWGGTAILDFASGVNIVGREALRETEGHDPKVIPEPGTMLLLGAGTAGLALVGHATRRSRSR